MSTTPNAPTAAEAGKQNVAITCEKGCRYLGFSEAVNHCPYCELGKAGDALAEALSRAQVAEAALLAARREVEAAAKRAKYAEATLDNIRFTTSIEGARQLADNYFAGRAALAAMQESSG